MSEFRKKPVVVEAITFDELVKYGIASGAGCHNGMPWSFNYETTRETDTGPVIVHHPITHENDDCYLIPTLEGTSEVPRQIYRLLSTHCKDLRGLENSHHHVIAKTKDPW